jgi:hypothetical protein
MVVTFSRDFHSPFTAIKHIPEKGSAHGGRDFGPSLARADCPMPSSSPMACFPLTRAPRYALPNTSLLPAFAALPSAHPAHGVDDELRWGPISMRVCTTCFTPSGPREVWDAALFHCGDRFPLARPMPSSSPMACIAHVRSHSCFARPHHAARGLGGQALRQPRLRAVVASSVLDAPSRQHGCRGPPSSEGRVGELHVHRDGVRAAASRSSPRSRACPPESAGVRAGAGL